MPKLQNDKQVARFDYDFAHGGGAIGAHVLDLNASALTAGMIITDMYVCVESPLTSLGTPTITLGNLDVDGFMADIYALAAVDNAVVRAGQVAGALLWDDTNDAPLAYRVGSDLLLNMSVGVAALTGGKLQVYVEYFAPEL
jgi:hypothetical protein